MKNYYYDEDEVAVWPLPQKIRDRLLTKSYVENALADGADPVELSLVKWQRVGEAVDYIAEHNTGNLARFYPKILEKIGWQTCALCIDSVAKFAAAHPGVQQKKEDKCTVCVLAKQERCIDADSAFARVVAALKAGDTAKHNKLQADVQDLIGHLEKIS